MSQRTGDSFVAIDAATTRLGVLAGDRIVEIGAVLVQVGRIVSEFGQLIHTLRPKARIGAALKRLNLVGSQKGSIL